MGDSHGCPEHDREAAGTTGPQDAVSAGLRGLGQYAAITMPHLTLDVGAIDEFLSANCRGAGRTRGAKENAESAWEDLHETIEAMKAWFEAP